MTAGVPTDAAPYRVRHFMDQAQDNLDDAAKALTLVQDSEAAKWAEEWVKDFDVLTHKITTMREMLFGVQP
jgi:hypothetical protein